ncbi:MAG TPA: ABC transporter permease/substrate-binding protein [Abditibacteriaceae bacterium]|jgi:osmoprotectant transport system permease protein
MSEWLSRNGRDLLQHTNEHLALVFIAMLIACAIGIPLGIVATRVPALQRPIIGIANIMQTVPSLALFGLLLPLLGLGAPNAIVALVLYSLLPLVRNTVAGITGIESGVRQSAVAMGMTDRQILWQVELPLASSVILAGVRVATVLCVGITTIAAFIDAGGLGVYIQNGLRRADNVETLMGAIPAALLALGADAALGALQVRLEQKNGLAKPATSTRSALWNRMALAPVMLLLALGFAGAVAGANSLFGSRNTTTNVSSNVNVSDDNASPDTTAPNQTLTLGSKDFTESRVLMEIVAQMAEAQGVDVVRKSGLGGSLPHQALVQGRIDAYPEYTGTAFTEILKHKPVTDVRQVYDTVKREYADKFGVAVSEPLGFSNGFAILIRGEEARRLGIKTISQAARYAPQWVPGFGPDFITRADGFPGFSRTYNLRFERAPRSMDLSLINRALSSGKVDLIAGNETDGLIQKLDLFQLQDDKKFFPPYQAVFLVRQDALRKSPALQRVLEKLNGAISTKEMQRLNYQIDGEKRDVTDVVRAWRKTKGF